MPTMHGRVLKSLFLWIITYLVHLQRFMILATVPEGNEIHHSSESLAPWSYTTTKKFQSSS